MSTAMAEGKKTRGKENTTNIYLALLSFRPWKMRMY